MRKKTFVGVMHENTAVEVWCKDNRRIYDDSLYLFYAEKRQATINYRNYNRYKRGL